MNKYSFTVLLCTILITGVGQAASHPFNVHDLLASKRVGAPVISPDGKTVLFSVRSVDETTNKSDSDLWTVDVSGGDVHQLTHTPRAEANYQWGHDGSVLFSRGKVVWQQALGTSKAHKLLVLPLSIDTMKLAPDGNTLAFTARVYPACDSITCSVKRSKKNQQAKTTGRIYHELFVRHWDTWGDGKRSHLFVTQLNDGQHSIRDLTLHWDADVPSTPFGGAEEYNFSPDSKQIFFSSRRVGRRESWSTNFDIYQVDLNTKPATAAQNLTTKNLAWDTQPVVSPDGKTMAYLAMRRKGYESDRLEIRLRDLASGKVRNLTQKWDRSISSLRYTTDGTKLLVTLQDLGNYRLYTVNLKNGKHRRLVSKGKVTGLDATAKILVYGRNDLKQPTELYRMPLNGGKPLQLTFFNKPLLSQVLMGDYQQFSFKGWNNEKVYGYMVKPAKFKKGKKYPLAFLIHGGPQGSFYNQYHYRWNPEIFAGAGYAVIMIDFHGSTGYGQKFTDSIQNDWGGKPLEDLRKGLRAAVRKYPFIDAKNSCALGASYGGYMINWIAGKWPDQFKCLVNHDGVFDNRMMYYATEELWFPEHDHIGPYYDYASNYEKDNPVNYVKFWKTPMMVIHSGHDFRIPESQGLGAFTALQRQGIASELLYFPDESHWVQKPANSVQWHQAVLGWLSKYLQQKPGR